MAFKHEPGFGSIFRNQYKEKDKQPDHKGSGCCPHCKEPFDISAWIKEGRNGKFFSLSIQEPYVKDDEPTKPDPNFDPDDDVPF